MAQTELTFAQFREANRTRCLRWHPKGLESWSASDWMTAIVGELGELASLIKMRNRERDGLSGNKFSPTDQQIADEAADVVTYLDLFCELHGIDLGLAAASKFNEVSERVGFPDRIELNGVSPGQGNRALVIADRAMFELLKSEAIACDLSQTCYGLTSDGQKLVDKLTKASKALQEACAWLVERGFISVDKDASGEFVNVLRRPGDE